ncbi:MAG: hypothetical protein COB30_004030 [Ectothiorhodospiraceae bacterium]|nr:hypothetical protein [Ectothiorhodospiraceae bacterium]
MSKITIIEGGCHCGNINYCFEVEKPLDCLSIRECTCSFCKKQGAIYASDPEGRLSIKIKNSENIIKYQFASKHIEFVFCKICGVMPLSVTEIDGNIFAVINIKTSNIELETLSVQNISFGEESIDNSIERRKSKWIPIVDGI